MKKMLLPLMGLLMLCASCAELKKAEEKIESHVLTQEEVESQTPDQVIEILKSGNLAFVNRGLHLRDYNAQLEESIEGQHPRAIILSCIDSRVPVETIFDQGLGDIFVARVAGNIINEDILGSMEYACEHSGSKVVLVLGHECCGAVHSACEGVDAGNMTQMLDKIKPAIDSCINCGIQKNHDKFEDNVVRKNVEIMVSRVRLESEILSEMEHEGKIKVVGAIFNLHTGIVEFI
ncbi:MAG: carbonic anhydrase family protein [Bacteroidales bacterium]